MVSISCSICQGKKKKTTNAKKSRLVGEHPEKEKLLFRGVENLTSEKIE